MIPKLGMVVPTCNPLNLGYLASLSYKVRPSQKQKPNSKTNKKRMVFQKVPEFL
jgi:hypothetical protein